MEAMFWLGLLVVLLVIEIITLGLTTIWFAGGALVAFVASALGANMIVQIVLFLGVSFIMLYFTRPVAVKYLNNRTTKTNVEGLAGTTARVTGEINNLKGEGQAVVNGQEWTARSSDDNVIIPVDAIVRIVKVSGVKLIVEKKEEEI